MKANFPVYAIVAFDSEGAIGKDGQLAWHLPEDLKHFAALTKGHTVLMGRKTYQSLPDKYRPLPQRLNLVLSSSAEQASLAGAKAFNNLDTAIDYCNISGNLQGDCLWIIGGEKIYNLTARLWDKVYVTKVKGTHQGDVFFPEFEKDFSLIESTTAQDCEFQIYARKN